MTNTIACQQSIKLFFQRCKLYTIKGIQFLAWGVGRSVLQLNIMLLRRTTWHWKRGFFKHTWKVMFDLLQGITCQLFVCCHITLTKRPISRPMCKIKLLFVPQLTTKTPKSFKIFTLLQFTFESFDINFFN